ncbi:MAG: SDR family oxidoreductase [Candidatus Pacebacteria bacterium]|jgi:NAD(P)-dependent dehydrogenase (short-subunit alcohol dehydrogenase family)|nr:SDR family oxidoreductase [Candidatus Paceibacterota bacterium]MBT4652336.1 SDR family oxidoreductase [Candidatus Paceibacterota bacterium]MBT6756163.1 SDR family oxidoreductase [Candidatus Paceibacterota bacterium]MBT6921732.1 SDR family oxidoreductase [Candidatus Paceibacterota bacterium]
MKNSSKLIIITGAASGIGLATSKMLYNEGWQLLLIDRNIEKLNKLKLELSYKKDIYIQKADLSVNQEIKDIFANKDIPWFNLHGLVNCAGTSVGDSILNISEKDWHSSLQVNLTAPFLLTKYFLDKKLDKKNKITSGSIVNISSMLGLTGGKKPNYAATKAGLIALTKSTALITGEYNIRVNAICPGAVDTPMTAAWPADKRQAIIQNTPLKRIAHPDEISNIIRWLLSNESSFLNGSIINATGGQYLGN